MADPKNISAEMIRSILDYDPESGVFKWRERPVSMFSSGKQTAEHNCAIWNGKFSGTTAGSIDGNGYVQIVIFWHRCKAHRLAWIWMTGEWPRSQIDHKNLDRKDNRWGNLRAATRSQNSANTPTRRDNASGYKGVCWHNQRQRWKAEIQKDGRRIHLGLFDSPEEAHAAYISAAENLHGEFSRAG